MRAKIEFNPLNLCDSSTGSDGATLAYTMMTARSKATGGDWGWAQVGYIRLGSDSTPAIPGTWNFTQYTNLCWERQTCTSSQSPWETDLWSTPDQALHIYTVSLNQSNDYVYMRIDGNNLTHMSHKAIDDWDRVWYADHEAEVKRTGDDVTGTASNKTSFYFLQRQLSDGSWQYYANWAAGFAPEADLARHHADEFTPADGLGFLTWTDPL